MVRAALTALFFLVATATLADSLPPSPDRSLLWTAEEAAGHVLPPEILDGWPRDDYGYDVLHVGLDLAVSFAPQGIAGTARLEIEVTGEGLTTVAIDLDDALAVSEVRVAGQPAAFSRTADQLLVDLASVPDVGQRLAIEVDYSGLPAQVGNKSMRWNTHAGVPIMYTLTTPYSTASATVIPVSHYWRPCKDVPDDKSTFDCTVTVRDDFRACSNGVQTADVDNGDGTRTFAWRHDFPIAPYLIAIGATNYQTIEEWHGPTLIQHFVYPEVYADAAEAFGICDPALTFMDGVFGPYPFAGEKFGHFHTPPGPAVEKQTLVALPAWISQQGHTYDWIVVHEMAHMWWGDAITCQNWAEVWLNEGFASYAEALWWEHLHGAGGLRQYMLDMDNGPWDGTIHDPPYVWHEIVYSKGAWVLHMLRHVLGDPAFFEALLAYREAHLYGNVVTQDLVTVCETVLGESLDWFFEPWIYHRGRPSYGYAWGVTGEGPYTVHLTVVQQQSPAYPTYAMPIDVRIHHALGAADHVVFQDQRLQSFALTVDDLPTGLELDPGRWILADFAEMPTAVIDGTPPGPAGPVVAAPNPFNPRTEIRFATSLPGRTTVRVFDAAGRKVRTLMAARLAAGQHTATWDGRDGAGREVASGVYVCRVTGPDGLRQVRLTLLR